MMQNLGKATALLFTAARCNERKKTVVIARNPLQSSGPAQGAAGIVKCCLNRKTDKRRACKIIKRGDVACMARIDREIRAMTLLKHPNVVQLHEVRTVATVCHAQAATCNAQELPNVNWCEQTCTVAPTAARAWPPEQAGGTRQDAPHSASTTRCSKTMSTST